MYGGNYTQCFVFANWGGGVFFWGGESASLLLRGWIVPVGDSIPDRRKDGTLQQCRLWNDGRQMPVGNDGRDLSMPVGLVPVGGCTPDRNDPPPLNICRAFKFGKALPQSIFQTAFCHLLLCFRGGGAFRSGVQPPTGSRVGGGRFSALAGVDRSGRGFNPRPALLPTGTPQLALPDRHSTSGIRYFRIWNCRETFGRGGAFRPCAGRGLYPRPERSTHARAKK